MRNIELEYDNKTNEYSLYSIFKDGRCALIYKSKNIEDIDNKVHSIYKKKQEQLFHECNLLLNKLNNLEELSKMDIKGFRYGDRLKVLDTIKGCCFAPQDLIDSDFAKHESEILEGKYIPIGITASLYYQILKGNN